jgi:hypothetical protein
MKARTFGRDIAQFRTIAHRQTVPLEIAQFRRGAHSRQRTALAEDLWKKPEEPVTSNQNSTQCRAEVKPSPSRIAVKLGPGSITVK